MVFLRAAVLRIVLFSIVVLAASPVLAGPINLELRPSLQSVLVGQTANIGIYVTSNDGANHTLAAADVVFTWAPGLLQLTGLNNSGGAPLLSSGFPGVSPNESNPPADGDGYYSALAFLGTPVTVTPLGTLLTTLKFTALNLTLGTDINVIPSGGSPAVHSAAYDGTIPNLDDTGTLGSARVIVLPEPASAALLLLSGLAILRRRRS